MEKESQKLLDALKYNQQLSEEGIKLAHALLEEMKKPIQIDSKIEEANAGIASALKLLKQYNIASPLDNIEYTTKPDLPIDTPIKTNLTPLKSFDEIVAEAHASGIKDTVIEDLLTPFEIAQADTEYLKIKKAFSDQTKLTKGDIAILLLTVALQIARQYVFSNEKFRFNTASDADNAIKKPLEKIIPGQWQDFLLGPVPYDAVKREDTNSNSTGLSGNTHRYRTLGHDPVLGWIFGPVNILTSSLTKSNFVTTYEIRNMKIGDGYTAGTFGAVNDSVIKAQEDKLNLPAAIVKQVIHFGTDYFTRQGLPLPFISSIDNATAQKFVQHYNIDTYSVTRGATISTFINTLISIIHSLFYNPNKHGNRKLFEVRTRKILLIANMIASTSNVIYVAVSKDLKKLDLGGLLVTIGRIFTDVSFIAQIENEFILREFDKIFQKDLDFLDEQLKQFE